MKIGVMIKTVPDTETKIKITQNAAGIDTQGIKYVMNTFDEFGVEEALRIKEQLQDGTAVTVISLGSERSVEILRTALAMGADEAVHVSDPAFEGGDSMVNAGVLAEVIRPYGFDLILCGKQGIDFDTAQTASIVAERLGLGQACVVVNLDLAVEDGKCMAKRRIEGGDEMVEARLPAVISCEKGLNEPRYASLPGIMKAKKKEIKKVTLSDIGFKAEDVGSAGSCTSIEKYYPLPERDSCRMLSGEPQEMAVELIRALREDSKII